MPSKHNQTYAEFKKLEDKWNQEIKNRLNCELFVIWAGHWMNEHLDAIEFSRMAVTDWLNSNGYITKDEVAEIAKRYIAKESKVDDQENTLYFLTQKSDTNRQLLRSLKQTLIETRKIMKDEYFSSRGNTINRLQNELDEVKFLFPE